MFQRGKDRLQLLFESNWFIFIIKVFPFLNGKTLLYFVCLLLLLFFFFRRFSKLIFVKSTQDIKMIFGTKYRVNKSYLVVGGPKFTIYLIGVISPITKNTVIAITHEL
jgi:hypothetical protein